VCNTKGNRGPYPFTFSLASVSILQSSWLYAPALSPLIRSYLSSFNMNYITFRTVETGKPYLFKEKQLWRKIKSVLICTRIYFFTWNPQNKIVIGHWDVELAIILSVFIFQVFAGEFVPACEHAKEKKQQ
jgi:hypothetical protein